jgi:hypothetical protein
MLSWVDDLITHAKTSAPGLLMKPLDVALWFGERMTEPSSYAALGAVILGAGVLIDEPLIIIAGIVGGVLGFILKEKGVI